jgi:ABC-type transport system involved in multi-copper enzyme maturation permease subunit
MTAFRTILMWEIRTEMRRVSTWVYFGIYFGLAFFSILAAGGAFDRLFGIGGAGRMLVNSPYALSAFIPVLALLGLSITAAMAGNALYRDYEAGIEPLVYTTPISKGEFLGGRFAGALVINLIVLSGIGIGAALAGASPWVRPEKIAPFELAAYVAPYLSFVLPNLVLTAAIFFALVSLTRQMLPIYAGGVLLLIGYLMAGSLLTDIDNKRLAALIDPFGLRAHSITTQYWSVADRNTLYVPFDGVILWNRMIWLAIGLAILAIAYRRFRFAHAIDDRLVTPRPSRETEEISPQIDELSTHVFRARVQPAELPRVTQRFDAVARLTQFRSVMMRSFWRIVRNRSFAVIMIGALIFLGVASWKAGRMFGTPTWPVTYLMEELLSGTILVFIVVIIAVYAGELVWAERDVKGQQIADATPVPTWVLFLAKLTALSAMIALIMVIMIVAGMMIQAAKGYYRFEIPLYVQAMFGFRYLDWVLLAALAMTIHVFSNHKYVGHLLVILTVVGMQFLPLLGLERNFYRYGSDAGGTYSDMNGWGPFLVPFVWWKAYWLAFCALMLLATNLFWVRGEETRLAVRMRLARRRFDRPARVFAAAAGLSFVGVGSFLYYNTTHVNVFRASTETRRLAAEREKRYKKYQNAPQPRITAVNVRVDLEPRRQAVAVSGYFVLVNKTERPIDTVHISLSEEMKIRALTFDGDGERLVADSLRDYYMYRLPRSLGPGDSTVMRFELAHRTRGIPNEVENTAIVENGTFVPSEFFLPAIGYSERNELSDDGARRKEGLLPKRLRSPTDVSARANNYVSHDADWNPVRGDGEHGRRPDRRRTRLSAARMDRKWPSGLSLQDGCSDSEFLGRALGALRDEARSVAGR